MPIKNNKFQKENTHTKKEKYRCQLKNFRAKKETFFEPKKKQNKSTLKKFPILFKNFLIHIILHLKKGFYDAKNDSITLEVWLKADLPKSTE